jgi:hypothetical protein
MTSSAPIVTQCIIGLAAMQRNAHHVAVFLRRTEGARQVLGFFCQPIG